MTQRLYLQRDELEAESAVISCTPADDGTYHVVLSATLFHPQGGGQPSDVGTIGDANVIRVTQDGEQLIHVCDRAVPVGEVHIHVDAAPRLLHVRLHSAGHLIGYVGETLGWRAVKAHHWPGEARVVFEGGEALQPMTPDVIERLVNEQVAGDLPRHTTQEGSLRKIGFGLQPAYPCGGTHVTSSGVVGKVTISKVKEKKGQVSVHYALAEE
jgi:alanyl-tRNA synthetase